MEIWKSIGYTPIHEISNKGRVRNSITKHILKTSCNNGYIVVRLIVNHKGIGKKKNFRVHRLVARAFLKNFDKSLPIDHINRVRADNSVNNLRISSVEENSKNRIFKTKQKIKLLNYIIGLHKSGFSTEQISKSLTIF